MARKRWKEVWQGSVERKRGKNASLEGGLVGDFYNRWSTKSPISPHTSLSWRVPTSYRCLPESFSYAKRSKPFCSIWFQNWLIMLIVMKGFKLSFRQRSQSTFAQFDSKIAKNVDWNEGLRPLIVNFNFNINVNSKQCNNLYNHQSIQHSTPARLLAGYDQREH